jgi:lipopolysaccharide transport system permease protein
MGSAELRQRYSRSRLGQFWVTLSTSIIIVSLGVVWSVLWGMPVSEMMPYFAASIVIWYFFTGILGDATTIFIKSQHYFINQKMSFATAISALIYQHFLALLHNALIIIVVFIIFRPPVGIGLFMVVPGLCLALIAGFWLSYVIAIICTRYRDVIQLLLSLLQVAFFVTPVLWKPDFLPDAYRELLLLNPFAVYLSIVRDPIIGEPVLLPAWLIATTISVGGFFLALPFIGRFQSRIVYWL